LSIGCEPGHAPNFVFAAVVAFSGRKIMRRLLTILLISSLLPRLLGQPPQASTSQANSKIETIVFIRHGEKPPAGLGQLTCQGLNRALALPKVLMTKFGKPSNIYAPDPTGKVDGPANFDYVRPLATIEPTAIMLGMPVNCDIRFDNIKALESELLNPSHKGQLPFVAWEHQKLNTMVKDLLKTRGINPDQVPDWPDSDYDRIYDLQIDSGTNAIRFNVDHEDLNNLSIKCPGAD
jgi:hypothetical protein